MDEGKGGSGASCLERRKDLSVKCPIPKPLAELRDRNSAAQATSLKPEELLTPAETLLIHV